MQEILIVLDALNKTIKELMRLPNLSLLSLNSVSSTTGGVKKELTLEDALEILMAPSDDEDTPPPKPFFITPPQLPVPSQPLLQQSGTLVTAGGMQILVSTDPAKWSVIRAVERDKLYSACVYDAAQPRQLAKGVVFEKLTLASDKAIKLLLMSSGMCGTDQKRNSLSLVVMDPHDMALSSEDTTIEVPFAKKDGAVQISTNPFRPTILLHNRFKNLKVRELLGTRSVPSHGVEMFLGLPRRSIAELKSLSIMKASVCFEASREAVYFLSAQLHEPESVTDVHERAQRPRRSAEERWKRRVNPLDVKALFVDDVSNE